MLDEMQGSAILKGFRGKPPCDLRAGRVKPDYLAFWRTILKL